MNTKELLACLALVWFFVFASDAQAYLDPGTGSLLLQSIIAGFLGVAVFWKKIVGFVTGKIKRTKHSPPTRDHEDSTQ